MRLFLRLEYKQNFYADCPNYFMRVPNDIVGRNIKSAPELRELSIHS
jgi:hypothetical protein